MNFPVSACPCFECICNPVCRNKKKWTFDLLLECSLAKDFYVEGHPYKIYQRFIAIRKCFGFSFKDKRTYDEMYKDWSDLINRNDYRKYFLTT